MKKLVLGLVFVAGIAQAETWEEFEHKTYIGGYYFAVCKACLDGVYNNDNAKGLWQCTATESDYENGCARGVWDAITAKPTLPGNR